MKVLVFPLLLGVAVVAARSTPSKGTQWQGTIGNGMKGGRISFVVAPDGKTLSQLTFSGYWRCGGKLEQITIGPDTNFTVRDGNVRGVAVDPPAGGASAWRYDLEGRFSGAEAATGTFRLNINALSCDTRRLEWTAVPVGPAE
ncbi:hypothetical protein GCM10027048_09540 [Hymenobacter coalescens]